MDRRRFLQAVGSAGVVGSLLGVAGCQELKGIGKRVVPMNNERSVPAGRQSTVDQENKGGLSTVEVDSFGAVGDSMTDDSTAIQVAADAPTTDDPRVLAFSSGGRYLCREPITVDAAKIRGIKGRNAHLVTDRDIVVLEYEGNNHEFTSGAQRGANQEFKDEEFSPFVRNLQIYSDPENPPYVGTGLRLRRLFAPRIVGCQLFSLETGVEFAGRNRNLVVTQNNIWDNAQYGILFAPGGNTHQANIQNNHIQAARILLAIKDHEIHDLHVVGNDIEIMDDSQLRGEHCILVANAESGTHFRESLIQANTIEDHGMATDGLVRLGGDLQRLQVSDNQIANSAHGIIVDSQTTSLQVQNNGFKALSGAAVSLRGKGHHQLQVTGNSGDAIGRFIDISLSDGSLSTSALQQNNARFKESNAVFIDVPDGMRDVHVTDNTMYPVSAGLDDDGFIYRLVGGPKNTLHYVGNQAFARGGAFSGHYIDDARGAIIKHNTMREVTTDATAFDFPSPEQGTVIVEDNVST